MRPQEVAAESKCALEGKDCERPCALMVAQLDSGGEFCAGCSGAAICEYDGVIWCLSVRSVQLAC